MGISRYGFLAIKRLLSATGNKPLVGTQVTFAVRTVKAALNGNGKATKKVNHSL